MLLLRPWHKYSIILIQIYNTLSAQEEGHYFSGSISKTLPDPYCHTHVQSNMPQEGTNQATIQVTGQPTLCHVLTQPLFNSAVAWPLVSSQADVSHNPSRLLRTVPSLANKCSWPHHFNNILLRVMQAARQPQLTALSNDLSGQLIVCSL